MNKIRNLNKLKNQKGISTLEFAICLMIFILVFSFFFDLFLIGYRQYTVSREVTNISRIVADQSGSLSVTPKDFPGGPDSYFTTTKLYKKLNSTFQGLGIGKNDWNMRMRIKTKNPKTGKSLYKTAAITPGAPGIACDYRDYIEIIVDYNYKWSLWNQFLPKSMQLKGSNEISRQVFSEYKADYSKWE